MWERKKKKAKRSKVGGEWGAGGTEVLQHHQLPEQQNYSRATVREGGSGRERAEPSVTLTLTDHCSMTV